VPVLLDIDKRLTFDRVDNRAANTHIGMAYFAGTGPSNKTCRECAFWRDGKHLYFHTGSKRGLKPVSCGKFRRMMGRKGLAVPHEASACKYFEQAENPPAITYRGK